MVHDLLAVCLSCCDTYCSFRLYLNPSYSVTIGFILFESVLFCPNLFYSVRICFILSYSVLSRSFISDSTIMLQNMNHDDVLEVRSLFKKNQKTEPKTTIACESHVNNQNTKNCSILSCPILLCQILSFYIIMIHIVNHDDVLNDDVSKTSIAWEIVAVKAI